MKEIIEWNLVKFREPTEEEIKDWEEREPYIPLCYMCDCKMPDDGEEILIQTKYGVGTDVCILDYGYGLEGGLDWDYIIAWARMPKGIEEAKNGRYVYR